MKTLIDFEFFEKQAAEIGSLTGNHSHILYGLIKWLRPKVAVEVGSWKGGSAVWLARALQENNNEGHLYCIDDFSLKEASQAVLLSNLMCCYVDDFVTIVKGKSDEVLWPEKIDFAFIDGDHSLQGCQKDVELAMERGASCIVIHDTTAWWGPRQWLEKWKKERESENWGLLEVTFDEGIVIALKHPASKPPLKYTP